MCQKYLSPFEGGGPARKPLVHGLTCFHDGFPRTLFLLLRSHRWQLFFSFHTTFYLVGGKVAITVFSPLMPSWNSRWARLCFRKPTNRVRTDWTLWRESRLLSLYKGSPRPRGMVLAGMLFNSRLACFVCVDICKGFHMSSCTEREEDMNDYCWMVALCAVLFYCPYFIFRDRNKGFIRQGVMLPASDCSTSHLIKIPSHLLN